MQWAAIAAIWRRSQPWLKNTGILVVTLWLIVIAHGEYVEYVQVTENKRWLAESFLVKWTFVFLSIVLYAVYNFRTTLQLKTPPLAKAPKETSEKELKEADDGFDFLRDKTRLKSRADQILDKD